MQTMQAVMTTGHGGLDKLEFREDVPVPEAGPGEVLIRVSACGLNNTDIWVREGAYGTARDPDAQTGTGRVPHTFPLIQGADVVGEIVAVGAGVSASRVGERVICNFMTYDRDGESIEYAGSLGNSRAGGYAQYVTVPSDTTYCTDSSWSDAELATLPCAYMTAENMLRTADVKAGETVLVTGASGGVGTALIQLAHARDATVVAVTSRNKRESVESLQPARVFLRDGDEPWSVLDDSVDVVADVVAGNGFSDLLCTLSTHGRYVTAGAIGGAVVPFDVRTLYLKLLTFHGVSCGFPVDFERVLSLAEQGRIRPLLHQTYALSQIREAQAHFKSKRFFGNLVVLP